ncbi:uncharacterized protein LOC106715753 [Papilio machaon]|uniref:uncharacterized protein LOC106715753 n=1 Tax=Papilio machaon TaxID=76193 RepID=UPI001E665692|nr:uncharacterized protein LOC106715753 [Papilio machaon]
MSEAENNIHSSDNSSESDKSPKTSISENNTKSNVRTRLRKRKRLDSSSSEGDDSVLAENSFQMEKNVHASAIKNNLDDVSVKKILKKVVTNDHVLALVKLREEEEILEEKIRPKLTRAKVKELMKDLPKSTGWNLENLELTPIKHIPVKTRPEVKALIAQELPEDEDDDEYQPTHDDVQSDDDHTMESSSDVDSLPRTPATPKSQSLVSPKVVKDGPFKVPQNKVTPTRRKLNLEEEATIALRTRSKLSLSATPIEHIESSFIPPDDVPTVDVDDPVWNEFLEECLNPASALVKNEDDDDADPEYNVAADPDIHDDEEEVLDNSIIKISKKELNDLMTELFNIMPEPSTEELASKVTGKNASENGVWEGKQEAKSDEESAPNTAINTNNTCFSIGKNEPEDIERERHDGKEKESKKEIEDQVTMVTTVNDGQTAWNTMPVTIIGEQISLATIIPAPNVVLVVEEAAGGAAGEDAESCRAQSPPPQPPQVLQAEHTDQPFVIVQLSAEPSVLPEQILILEQQIRQHIQLAASNFLQLFTHPTYWSYAPKYKEYLETLNNVASANPKSVVNVCNLKPALDLVTTWENTVSEVTPENTAMVEHIKKEVQRSRNRSASCSLHIGDFHDTLKDVVANSCVFLYPHLLPPMMYRPDSLKRFKFLPPEDRLIALGLDEFWSYVEENPELYPLRNTGGGRAGLKAAVRLLCRYMLTWLAPHTLLQHVRYVRRNDKENPICKFFESRKVEPVQHKLLPYNPRITLYEQPEYEMPRIWLRHLAKTSKRFRDHLYGRDKASVLQPKGVDITLGKQITPELKKPLPNDVIKTKKKPITYITPETSEQSDTQIIYIEKANTSDIQNINNGTITVNSVSQPICSASEILTNNNLIDKPTTNEVKCQENEQQNISQKGHCNCCVLLRKICKQRQTLITEYIKPKRYNLVKCPCKSLQRPKITNKLRMLLRFFKHRSMYVHKDMAQKLSQCKDKNGFHTNLKDDSIFEIEDISDPNDLAFATSLQMKMLIRLSLTRNPFTKKNAYINLSQFDVETGDPVKLAKSLEKIFDVELVDIFKEFLRCLTPEQADKINRFKDYFTQACAPDLVKRISEEVTDKKKRHALLSRLIMSFTDNKASACDICTDLLTHMDGHAQLAAHTFNLFPHKRCDSKNEPQPVKSVTIRPECELEKTINTNIEPELVETVTDCVEREPVKSVNPVSEQISTVTTRSMSKVKDNEPFSDPDEQINAQRRDSEQEVRLTICEEPENMDCEDHHSSPDHTNDKDLNTKGIEKEQLEFEMNEEKYIPIEEYTEEDISNSDGKKLNLSDIKVELIMSDDETVKSEAPEWQRSEDRLILEVLKQSFTREERKNKTILDIVEEMDVLQIITDSLPHKSVKDVTDRVMYLLDLLVISEN